MKVFTPTSSLRDALLLLIWGAFILWLGWTAQLSSYLHPSLQPYALLSGVLLLLLSLLIFRGILISPKREHECCHGHDQTCGGDHHDHEGIPIGGFLFRTALLLLPLGIILSGQDARFTMATVQNRGVVDDLAKLPSANASASASVPPAKSQSGAMPLQIIDMLYGIQMPSYREEFEGKDVEMIGQYVPMTTGNPKGDRFQAIRMFITCCAADAKPVGVTVHYPSLPKIPEMAWVKIIGKPTFPMEGGRRTAVLEATTVESCAAPSEPFVY